MRFLIVPLILVVCQIVASVATIRFPTRGLKKAQWKAQWPEQPKGIKVVELPKAQVVIRGK